MWIEYMAYIGGLLLMISFLPQIVQSVRTKKTSDLSWGMLLCTMFSGVFYEIYAIALNLKPVIIMNGIFVAMMIIQIILKTIYDRKL